VENVELTDSSDRQLSPFEIGVVWFLLIISPLKGIATVNTPEAADWLLVDYVLRGGVLAVIATVSFLRTCIGGAFGTMAKPYEPPLMLWLRIGSAIVLALFLMVLSEFWIRQPLVDLIPDTRLGGYTRIDGPILYWIDITFGLALVAVSEEFVFRAVLKEFLGRINGSIWFIVVASSILFGLAHWAHGVPNVIDNAVTGAILMVLYMRTGSIVPPIIAHYLINVWYFA